MRYGVVGRGTEAILASCLSMKKVRVSIDSCRCRDSYEVK